MKYLLTLAIVVCSVAFSFGQNNEITLTGLVKSGQATKLTCTSITYQASKKVTSGRATGTTVKSMRIVRRVDGNSAAVEQALISGKLISNAQLSVREANGKTKKYTLTNVAIYAYEAVFSNGKNAEESFEITFNKKTPL